MLHFLKKKPTTFHTFFKEYHIFSDERTTIYAKKIHLEIWNDVLMSEGILHPLQGHIPDNYQESLQWIDGIQIFGEFEISVRAQAQRKK